MDCHNSIYIIFMGSIYNASTSRCWYDWYFYSIGSQSILKDIINGFVIMSSGVINIGDTVDIKGNVGVVKSFTLNNIILENSDKDIIIIPSGVVDILTKKFF